MDAVSLCPCHFQSVPSNLLSWGPVPNDKSSFSLPLHVYTTVRQLAAWCDVLIFEIGLHVCVYLCIIYLF